MRNIKMKILKNATQSNLEQNANTLAIELLLSLSEVINFRMLEAKKKCLE